MNWTQELCKELWLKCGADKDWGNYRYIGRACVCEDNVWLNPAHAPLETLLDVLERLAGDNTITIRSYRTISKTRRYAAWINEQTPEDVCSTYKAAVVAAICQLIGLEVGNEDSRE